MRNRKFRMTILCGVAITTIASAASAQSDVVIMRRVIAKPNRSPAAGTPTPTPTPAPTPTPTPVPVGYYNWTVGSWTQSGTCGSQGIETRTVTCQQAGGITVDDQLCTTNGSGPKPADSQAAVNTTNCTFSWVAGPYSDPQTTCGPSTRTRDITCQRSDGTIEADADCTATKPDVTETTTDVSGCSFSWSVGSWSAPSNTCGAGTETRPVLCERSDGTSVADASCASAGTKPDATQAVTDTSTCTTSWYEGSWSTPAPACGASTETRTVTCDRSDGAVVDDAQCTGAKPAITQAATDYSTCTDGRTAAQPYNWTLGTYSAPSTTCGTATETRTVQCLDGSKNTVASSLCVGTEPATSMTTTVSSGCSYTWQTGDFRSPEPGCGPTTATRDVTCQSSNGSTVDYASCDAATKPSDRETVDDYRACTFAWAAGAYSAPSSTCGNATETRTITCQRSDGTTADDSECANAGAQPATTQTSYETSGCGVSWQETPWVVPSSCGSTTETRTVSCLRSDGSTVDDSQCAVIGSQPPASQATTDYSACTFKWATTQYSGTTTTCGTYDETRSVTCQRSDGTGEPDADCTDAKPASSETITDTSTCSYSWSPDGYTGAVPACGASTHSRTVNCKRSDGALVDASFCSGAGPEPVTSEATTDYSTCSYAWTASAWQGTSGCGNTVTQSRSVACQRSDGTDVTSANASSGYAYCSKSSMPPATQPITDYSQCSYTWASTPGTWSSTCSASATRPESVTCVRQDGTTVDNSYCSASTMPAAQDTGNYAGCTFTPTYGAYTMCNPYSIGNTSGVQTASITSCTRSDGTVVANSSCSAQSTTKPCTITYSGTYGACTATTSGGTSGSESIKTCTATGNDGQSASYAGSACASTQACTLTYVPTYASTYSACVPDSNGASTGTQTKAITACTETGSDGTTSSAATASCKNTTSQTCTPTYTASYTAYQNCTPLSQGSTTGTETATINNCTSDNGVSGVPLAACSSSQQTETQSCTGITYTATYNAYGTCTNSSQSATIKTCTVKAADGVTNTVDTALCPSSMQTQVNTPCTKTLTCNSTPIYRGRSSTTTVAATSTGTIANLTAAFNWCVANAGTAVNTNTNWNCYWNGVTGAGGASINVSYATGTASITYSGTITAPAANYACTAQ